MLNTYRAQQRPVLFDFEKPIDFLKAMLVYLRACDAHFTILSATRSLRKVSPALVSLILQGKRKITLDRMDELAKLFSLTVSEKSYLKNWLMSQNGMGALTSGNSTPKNRKEVSTHILNDWLNVYVKDCFQISEVQKDRKLVYRQLAQLGSPQRIDKSIEFLMREGHLRKTMDGKIVTETPLTITDPHVASDKIKQFHKNALNVAKIAMDNHPVTQRYANTFIVSISEDQYEELIRLIQDFAEKMKDFVSESSGDRLYQVIINASPTGGTF